MKRKINISVVVPVYNEEANVRLLFDRLTATLNKLGKGYEIIFVDDGSTDGTLRILKSLKNIKIIKFTKNFGQTAAMSAGFKHAKGSIIVAIDGDLQNDPKDIPKLLERIEEGFDVVSGWRYDRKDSLSKTIPSVFANFIRRKLTGEKIHDSGCSLKAYRKECFNDIDLYGEMHRYIPAILMWKGFRVGEAKVIHFKRTNGKSKYGITRLIKGLLDLFVVLFWQKYSVRPVHIFGGFGLFLILAGGSVSSYMIIGRLLGKFPLSDRPLFLLSIVSIVIGIQFLVFGILADILIKIYYNQKNRREYKIEKIVKT
ncbi:glycosyltransferase family 2 protein [Candidatus Woesearchaeota archaeon]|nr:glycosyltransferase family 2 protein [Candidatus Woesearchaeota archaeon]